MRKLISFALFSDWIEPSAEPQLHLSNGQRLQLNPPYISFELLLDRGSVKHLSGLFHFDPPIPFSIDGEVFLDIVFNLKGRQAWVVRDGRTELDDTMILDLESTVNQIFNQDGTEVIRLICTYYAMLWVLQEHPFAYDLDLPLPHLLEQGNYFNRNAFRYFSGHIALAYHLPYLPICMIALAGKALELINMMYCRVDEGPILPIPSLHQTCFRLLKYYAQSVIPHNPSPMQNPLPELVDQVTQDQIAQLSDQLDQIRNELEQMKLNPVVKTTPVQRKLPLTVTIRKPSQHETNSNPCVPPPPNSTVSQARIPPSQVGGTLDLLLGDS